MTTTTIKLRDLFADTLPTWLNGENGSRYNYLFGVTLDVLLQWVREGKRASMPGYGDASALPYIGRDRGIPQGIDESADSYAGRLQAAIDDWHRAGNAGSIVGQLLGYVPAALICRCVNYLSCWDQTVDGNPATGVTHIDHSAAPDWNWDRFYALRAIYHFMTWVILDGTETWSQIHCGDVDLRCGDGHTCGSTMTDGQVRSIRNIVKQWKAQGAVVRWIIVMFDNTIMDPLIDDPTALPDGTWEFNHKTVAGVDVPARDSRAIYLDGVT